MTRPSWALRLPVFLAALSLYTLTAGGSLTSTDAVVTFDLTRQIVEHRTLALSGNLLGLEANRGTDGRYYSQYGIGQSLFNIPFYLAGRTIERSLPRQVGKPDSLVKAAVAMGSAVAAAAAVLLLWELALLITGHARAAFVTAAAAAVATPLWPYSAFGFSTPLVAALLAGAACGVWRAGQAGRVLPAAAAGGVLAFGWLTRHEMALIAVPFAGFLLAQARARGTAPAASLRQVAAFAVCTGVGGLLWLLYNEIRFGAPTYAGYTPAFALEGFAAYLISPGASVLLFCPIAVLWTIAGFRAARVPERILLLGPLAVSYLFFGSLLDWPGGRSYGPRYLVPALTLSAPLLAVALARARTSARTLTVVIAVCAVLQLPGVLVDYAKVSAEWAESATDEQLAARNWRLASSPLILNLVSAARNLRPNAAYLTGLRPLPDVLTTSSGEDRGFSQQFRFSLDFWWAYLVYLRAIGRGAMLGLVGVLTAAVVLFTRLAWRASASRSTS